MKPSEIKALERALDRLSRPPRRRVRWFSKAAVYLGLGLALGYVLLVQMVPMMWGTLLPRGIDQANTLVGLPALVWRLSVVFRLRSGSALVILGGLTAAGFVASALLRPLRFVVWLAAVAVVALDAGILIVTIKTAFEATIQSAGVG
jgi:hypothetical protein